MNEPNEPSDFDLGVWSNHWMLKAALMYVPRDQLNLAVVKLIDTIIYGDGDEDLLDILAQYALTARYIKTREHDGFEPGKYDIHAMNADSAPMPQAEIDRQVAEFVSFLESFGKKSDGPVKDEGEEK